jgi:hypothetical protein
MVDQTADEARKSNIEKMGDALGTQFSELWQEVAQLHFIWAEYVALFGTKPSRVDLLNQAAPRFFRIVQDALWENTLLHIARLTDSPDSGKGKANLTIQNLPGLIGDPATASNVARSVETVVQESKFCRDWRNRHIAHRDLVLALKQPTDPLESASRKQVNEVLDSIAKVLNAVQSHYCNSETHFRTGIGPGGSLSLLYALGDGFRMQAIRRERLERGEISDADFPRDL